MTAAATPRERAFFELIDESYLGSVHNGPPLPYPKSGSHGERRAGFFSFAAGLSTGAVSSLVVARIRSERRRIEQRAMRP